MRWIILVLIAFALVGSVSSSIHEINVAPGQTVSISVTVKNDAGYAKVIDLSYNAPPGFVCRYIYNGKIVKSLYLNASEEKYLTFQIDVPQNARGYYTVSLDADGSYTIVLDVSYPSNPIEVFCPYTGITVEAGEVVKFPITITNELSAEYPIKLNCKVPKGWSYEFFDNGIEVYKITLSPRESRTLILQVDTNSSSEVGTYNVIPIFNNLKPLTLQIYINKTHRGENGEVKIKVVNRQGEGVASAKITIGKYTFYTSAEGEGVFDLPPGKYDVKITKPGYYEKEIKGVVIRAGLTTNLGTVYLQKMPYYAELIFPNPNVTVPIGVTATVSFTLKNVGYASDTYALEAKNLPNGVYVNFLASGISGSEVYLKGGDSRTINMELMFSPNVKPGKYRITVCACGHYTACKNLTLTLRGQYSLSLEPEGGRYLFFAEVGGTKVIHFQIINAGVGASLTNISIDVSAPNGWKVDVEPSHIPVLKPQEIRDVTVRVHVPPDAVPSEYKLKVKAVSDQVASGGEIKIIVKEKSYAAVIGGVIIVGAIVGLVLIFRKFGRR